MFPLHFVVAMLCGWRQREPGDVIALLRDENRVLKARLEGHRLRLTDDERRRLAQVGHRVGRRLLACVATNCDARHHASVTSLIGDCDPNWSRAMEERLRASGGRGVRTPAAAPNCTAFAERVVR